MPPKVILLSGCKRAGKDTLANRLIERLPAGSCERYSFADPLREVCSIAFGFTAEDYQDDRKDLPHPEWGISPRQALIQVGTEYFRKQIHPDVWIKETLRRMARSTADYIFITDARFLNEIESIRRAFPSHRTVLVIRPDVVPADGTASAHSTEVFAIQQSMELTYPFDHVYVNQSLDDVTTAVDNLYQHLMDWNSRGAPSAINLLTSGEPRLT